MHTVRIRLIGDELHADALMNMLHEIAGVEIVEAVLPAPDGYSGRVVPYGNGKERVLRDVSHIEVGVADSGAAARIRTFAAGAAMLMDASAEFVEHF